MKGDKAMLNHIINSTIEAMGYALGTVFGTMEKRVARYATFTPKTTTIYRPVRANAMLEPQHIVIDKNRLLVYDEEKNLHDYDYERRMGIC